MNKQCYRVVFNKARGMMMVVSEVTKSQNKKAGNSSGKKSPAAKSESNSGINVSYHRLAMAILCCQSMVYTQVQAATSAIQNTASNVPVAQRAALLKAANGTPIVNIRTPNSNGLSHNTYNQFDIGSNGAVLNNSMGSANTHLAGNIAGNQYLAQGVANTILNEVRSNAAVKFQGNIEIAGQRADVIIASPSGLQVQGGGFINANQATLATGTPKIDSAGNLTGFDIKQGQVQFDNAATGNALGGDLYDGKNKNQANYVDVLARAVTINGQIHANQDINIVSGSNTVDYDTGTATKITGTGTAPTLAVDVSALGGIYANSINLVGTESGLGVRNAGNINATQQIVLTNSGKIENTGTIKTTKAQTSLVSVNATGTTGSIEHSGTIGSYGMIDMQADKDILLNGGIIRKENPGTNAQLMPDILRMDAAGDLKMSNTSDVRNFTVVNNEANIYMHSGRDTFVDSQSIVGSNGGISIDADRYVRLLDGSNTFSRYAPLTVHSRNGTLIDNSRVTSRGDIHISASKDDNTKTADTVISNNSKITAEKNLTVSGERDAYIKSGSSIAGANEFALQAGRNAVIDNAGSIKVTNDAALQAGELAYLKDSIQPITIGKQLSIEGKQATVLNSTANANDGIYITSQGKATTITNSTLNSTKGAVTAIANQAALNVNKMTTDANSTILAAGSNVGVTASTIKADNIVVESGATTTINGLMTAAKDTKQIGGTSILSKENINVSNSTLNSTGNINLDSDGSLILINDKINAKGVNLETATPKVGRNVETNRVSDGYVDFQGEGDIYLQKTEVVSTGTSGTGINIVSGNYLNLADTKTKSTGNTTLKSSNLMAINNSEVNSDKHLVLDSNDEILTNAQRYIWGIEPFAPSLDNPYFYWNPTNFVPAEKTWITSTRSLPGNTTLKAGEVLSVDSASTQSYQNTDIIGGAVLINSDSNIALNINTSIASTGNNKLATSKEKLPDGKAISTLNGDLSIASKSNLTIDPKIVKVQSRGDISLTSREGKLHLKGYAGERSSSLVVSRGETVNLTTSGNINLTGKEVLIEAAILKNENDKSIDYIDYTNVDFTKSDYQEQINAIDQKYVPGFKRDWTIPYTPTGPNEYVRINNEYQAIRALEIAQGINSTKPVVGGVNITATNGSVELKGIKEKVSDFTWGVWEPIFYVSSHRVQVIEDQIKLVNAEITSTRADTKLSIQNKNIEVAKLQGTLSDLNKILETSKKASRGYENKTVTIDSYGTVNVSAQNGGVLMEATDVTSRNGGINVLAKGNLKPIAFTDGTRKDTYNDSIRITGLVDVFEQGDISAGRITGSNYSDHQIVNQPKLKAKGNIQISGEGSLAEASDTYNSATKSYITNNGVVLNSADIISTAGNVRIDASTGDIDLEASQASFLDRSKSTSTSRKWYGKKKSTTTTKVSSNNNAVTTDIQANNISLTSDGNINIYGSDIAAPTGTINISAGKLLNLYAVDDVNYNSTEIQKRSSFLGVRYNKDNTNDTRQELTQLPTTLIGDKAYTASGGSTLLEGTVFNTLQKAVIKVGVGEYADDNAVVILAPITNQITTTHTQDRESTVWMKKVDQGSVVTIASLPKFNQVPTITSPGGVTVAVPVEVTVDANNKAKTDIQKSSAELGKIALDLSKQPGYEYLATLDKDNDINWVQVDLIQKNWDYTQEGLTPGAAALIAIAITVAAGPAGSGLTASMVATNAAGLALQTQAVITLINNKGDISKTLKDMASSDTIRNMATAALTAGLTAKLNLPQMANNDFANKLVNGVAEGATGAFVNAAVNGVNLEDALKNSLRSSLVDVFAAETFSSFVKNIDTNDFADNLAHKLVAAGVGCVTASAKKQSCDAGALGAAVGEMFGDYLVDNPNALTDIQKQEIINAAKLLAGSIALLTNVDVNAAAEIAGTAVKNNSLKNIEDYCGSFSDCFEEFRKKGSISQRPTDIYKGDWQLIAVLDKQGKTIGYTAYNTKTKTTDFIVRTNEVQEFKNATPTLIENAVALFALTQMKPKYQYDAEVAIMNRDVNAFGQAWTDALSSPGYYLFVGLNATGGVIAKNIGSKVYVYRKMSVVEANVTKSSNRLQPSISGSNSSKYLSEDLAKVKAFSNKGVTEPQVIVRFELDPIQYNSMMAKAVNQNNSKGINAIKLNNEGITNPKLNNIGVPSGILNDFNRAIKPNGVKIYE